MNYIKGNYKNSIYENASGYKVGLFRVKETNDEELKDYLNKTITFTGYFNDLNTEDKYVFYGELIFHDRYGVQYQVKSYEKEIPTTTDSIIEFLSSSLITGCGEKTALAIVNTFGEKAIDKIKENKENLLLVPNITIKRAEKIYNSILRYSKSDETIVKLKNLGFSIKESSLIINDYKDNIEYIIDNNIYLLNNIIYFDKLDRIFLNNHEKDDFIRIKACILESMNNLVFKNGDTYHFLEEIGSEIRSKYQIVTNKEIIENAIKELKEDEKIIVEDDRYYLKEYYEMEIYIANALNIVNNNKIKVNNNIDKYIPSIEKIIDLNLSDLQKEAVTSAMNSNVCIITGGPGTGKTTVVNAIVKMFIEINNYDNFDILANIALLAPTGRASKRLSEVTHLPAKTIHRFLKWNKETNDFQIDESNKSKEKLIIVDETSMIDTFLMDALLKGINRDIKLILIGDENQLPSVGGGLILNDLIDSGLFTHINLTEIFRQSSESYIPYLARDIKNHMINSEMFLKKNDYNFIETPGINIKSVIEQMCSIGLLHQKSEKEMIVLAPMYKGENGIDNLNILLQNIYNPKDKSKNEMKFIDVVYRENDKVIELVNDVDNNVFNGDIGYIEEITPHLKDVMTVNYDGIKVKYQKDDLIKIKHAYAISIHKSQGSEFDNVILPVTSSYSKMLYNKIIYTGVSRAKKCLVIIGSKLSFTKGIENDYSLNRKTTLKERLLNK